MSSKFPVAFASKFGILKISGGCAPSRQASALVAARPPPKQVLHMSSQQQEASNASPIIHGLVRPH